MEEEKAQPERETSVQKRLLNVIKASADLTWEKYVRRLGRSAKGGRARGDVKTRIQHPEYRIQPRNNASGCAWTRKVEKGEDAPTGRRRQRPGRSRSSRGGKRRLEPMGFYRIGVCFYRISTGCYRINIGFYRLFPHLPASYRINFFAAKRIGESGVRRGGIAREKLRVFAHFSTVFHGFTHRTGPYLRDFTHFYGLQPFLKL